MSLYDEMMLARNEVLNHINAIMESMKLSEMQMVFVMEAAMNDLRCRCMIRECYNKASNDVHKKECEKEMKDEKKVGE